MSPEIFAKSEEFIIKRISGTRHGSQKPQWHHSCEVRDTLIRHGYGVDVALAGLLHDAIEDANATIQELRVLGCSDRALQLIDLATHESAIEHKDHRWTKMMVRLTEAGDAEAWAIKIADLLSNLADCGTMPADRSRLMIEVKAGLMLALSAPLMKNTLLYKELELTRERLLYVAT